jgi:polysaccharide biosynthesis protein PslH
LETLYISPYIEAIRKYSDAKIVLRSHNIEYLIWERLATSTNSFFRKAYLKHLANTLKKYEIKAINKYDGIAAITSKDAEHLKLLGCKKPICDIPLGIDLNNYSIIQPQMEVPSLFHIGSMNWMPNEEAVKWFLSQIWDEIHMVFPKLKLYLAGRNMPDWLLEMKMPNVEIVGEVEDALTFIGSKQIMVVPLLSGSGMRVKIMEGMALGKIIISTTIGAEGIDYENGKNIILADSPAEFNKMIKYCLNDQNAAEQIGIHAKKLIEEKYDNKVITEKLISFYHQILNK